MLNYDRRSVGQSVLVSGTYLGPIWKVGNLLAYSHKMLNEWKNYFSQLLNVHSVSDTRQREMHTAEPLVPGPSRLEDKIAVAVLKKYKTPGSD
jgi:hypothetical protein